VKLFWIILLVICLPNYSHSQQPDSVYTAADSLYSYFTDSFNDAEDAHGVADSSVVSARNFSDQSLRQLGADPDLKYTEPPTVAESLWDRLLALLGDLINSLFQNAVTTNWGRLFSYTIGLVVVIAIIMMLLRVNAFKVFYNGQGESGVPYNVLDENIHEMNFDSLIAEAVAGNDFRKGIRLLFLKGLKMLADRNFIQWQHGKTNHDYLAELQKEDLKNGFNELNYYFEYAWYGNFSVNHDLFKKVQQLFTNWSRRIQ
jgi:hypothetical protein